MIRRVRYVLSAALAAASLASSSAAHAQGPDTEGVGSASLILDNQTIALKEVSGLETENETTEIKRSLPNGRIDVIKTVGAAKMGKAILRFGWSRTDPIQGWRQLVLDGKFASARKSVTVVLTQNGKEVGRFTLVNAWPSKYGINPVGAKGSSGTSIDATASVEYEGLSSK